MAQLDSVTEVQIDPEGVFKYILIRVSAGAAETDPHRDVVRGTKSAEYHNHIFDKVNPEIQALGLQCKCLGGGKIEHNSAEKKIRVYGESTGYGRADHAVAAEKLKRHYKDYEVVCEDK
ncbi:PREDICTED: 14 kDa phosphohistidine phosphatase-like [Nanorana parkeri]|uniref:14 kDa phosphohistidine phosphatase-like n=1 Tax=Nanorana parkeri TaxID=125878 RepID=UPI00085437E8|nr:PREDICTED: 14 kDa phosphohistidine phosphatase-like [Nanorana parkeri]